MGKYIFLGINSIIVLFFGLFAGDDVSIKHNLPATAAQGSQFVAEFTVKKGTVNQFGKLQIELPSGFTASEVESLTGKFTFENNMAKILWIQLPKEEEFTVKMKITVGTDISGPKTISGKFQFVAGNEKKQAEMSPHEITVSGGAVATDNGNSGTTGGVNTNTVSTTNTNTVVSTNTTTTSGSGQDSSSFNKPDEPGATVVAERTITKEANGTYKVSIRVKKGQIKSFAKYMDVLPEGVTATKGTISGGGNFKFFEHKASVIWPTLPKDEEVNATYTIKVTGTFTTNPVVSGSFSYLDKEQTAKVNSKDAIIEIIAPTNTVVETNTVVATNTVTETNTVTPTNTVTETNTVVATNTVTETNTVTPTNTVTETNTVVATNTVAPVNTNTVTPVSNDANVNFHVQIGAYKNAPQSSYFASKFNISEKISTDMHEGLTKFLVGKFQDYKSGRDFREKMKSKGVNDAFVTAYNAGKRITVQEGLMVTKQKWFK